jgi:4-amino-4-deoxy-L-arabinose transferase-like glycosyltransferase
VSLSPARVGAGAVLALLGLLLLVSAGLHPLLLPDEGRYVGVAYAMLHGDALVPTLHGLPFFHKPPLLYWIDIAAFHLFGVNEWAARAAPMLGAGVMALALWLDLSRRQDASRDTAFSVLLLATTPAWLIGGQYANHDMLVAGWITLTIVGALRALDATGSARVRWILLAWAAAALAVLSKGLIGVVLPVLVLVPWLLAQGRWRDALRLLHPAALLVFALIVTPWFIAMEQRFPGFLDYFIVEQHFRRYTQTGFNNPQPFWFFIVALPLITLPWTLWLPATRRLPVLPLSSRNALYVWWIVVVLVFFSLPRSKLVGYVLPALAPLAALLATTVGHRRGARATTVAALLVCLALVSALAWRDNESHRDIGQALGSRFKAGDRVVFVNEPFYDVPFYARLSTPPVVLSDWDDPTIPTRDNWRKELRDGVRFDPAAGARQLWPTARAEALRCGAGTLWIVARTPTVPLVDAQLVLRGRHALLLRVAGRAAADCP